MTVVETTTEERRLLRRAGQLVTRDDGRVYVDSPQFQARAARGVVQALLDKGLMVPAGSRFRRTEAGDLAVATDGVVVR